MNMPERFIFENSESEKPTLSERPRYLRSEVDTSDWSVIRSLKWTPDQILMLDMLQGSEEGILISAISELANKRRIRTGSFLGNIDNKLKQAGLPYAIRAVSQSKYRESSAVYKMYKLDKKE